MNRVSETISQASLPDEVRGPSWLIASIHGIFLNVSRLCRQMHLCEGRSINNAPFLLLAPPSSLAIPLYYRRGSRLEAELGSANVALMRCPC